MPVTVSWVVALPTTSELAADVTARDWSAGGGVGPTVIRPVAAVLPEPAFVAVMTAVPCATGETLPVESTVTTLVFEDTNVDCVVRSLVRPSL